LSVICYMGSQCYLPSDTGECASPWLQPSREASMQFTYHGKIERWVDLRVGPVGYMPRWLTCQAVAHLSNNHLITTPDSDRSSIVLIVTLSCVPVKDCGIVQRRTAARMWTIRTTTSALMTRLSLVLWWPEVMLVLQQATTHDLTALVLATHQREGLPPPTRAALLSMVSRWDHLCLILSHLGMSAVSYAIRRPWHISWKTYDNICCFKCV